MIALLFTFLLLLPHPGLRIRVDRRECDGERYGVVCVGLKERAETWECVEL